MNWLFDQPIYIALGGIVFGFLAGVLWSSTGSKAWLAALGVVIAITAGLLITERLVVTDREAIRQTLAEIARDVQSNDVAKVVRHIAPDRPDMAIRARTEMPNYRFTECRVTKVHGIDVNERANPRTALVEFNVVVAGSFRQGGMEASGNYPRWVRLHLVKDKAGQWLVYDYEHAEPHRMLLAEPGSSEMRP
ncbi:MAG: hypothetical protein SFU86_08720 [Pirellulaceae bacterium]|nr:hypothetical protein [Pirellulaceae bacterium]